MPIHRVCNTPLYGYSLRPFHTLTTHTLARTHTNAHTNARTHAHTHTHQLIEALESFVSGTRTRLRKMMIKKREREAAAYVNLKPRNASMAVEVSTLNCQLTLFCCLAGVFLFTYIHNLRTSFLSYLTYYT